NNFSLRNVTKLKHWAPIPSGDGQRLALNIQANGLRYQSYSFSFTEPWLGGRRPNSLTVSLSKVVSRNVIGDISIGHLKINGGSVSFGRRLTWPDDNFTLIHSLSYYNYDIKDYAVFENFTTGTSNNISLVNTFARNSINSPIYPLRGSSVSLSVNLTPPYSLFRDIDFSTATPAERFKWVEFHKWMFDASWFLKLAGNLVLNARTHYGFIGTYSDKMEQGPFERFRLGGSGLGAGNFLVGTDFIGLRGYDDQSVITAASAERGGVAFNKFVLELRHPVTLNPAATVFGLVFAEAGNNFGSLNVYDPFNLKRSVGVGARVFMPAFGLLGFDYGYGFDNVPGSKKGQFHFMIGQQLR
ncbi:MAG: BamA/TamA family outer membrane protein, partial [Hymenobacteraceae bacterium]|nr:BamA/TamA family outer membrane protein [Hymenobacteraceae bacterium]MDX5396546.1 BamA/TamA family outer membrane protein [Hymenobacteraceae bacterium]MDX5443314.1 BamA/TamA family outer membrane protein [Hymenobacteraceae bacterium]MDX5512610.1 BamA/TamA family outer membrane protein [Hymenobacteraceae bacterium]